MRLLRLILAVFVLGICVGFTQIGRAEETSADKRLAESAKYLSSDELEGRGVGLAGLDKAADYIAKEFAQMGLKTELFQGQAFHQFTMMVGSQLGKNNSLTLVPADGSVIDLKIDKGFRPLALGGAAKFDLPLVFAGYGITAKNEGYDDYAHLDVKDKAVLILRHEPQQENPHSKLNGDSRSVYAPFARKVSNAYEHGAAAVLFVTDDFTIKKQTGEFENRWHITVEQLAEEQAKFKQLEKPTEEARAKYREAVAQYTADIQKWQEEVLEAADPLLSFQGAGDTGERREMPVVYLRRSVANELVKRALGKELAEIERDIDKTFEPQSAELAGWRAQGQTDIEYTEATVKNVVGVWEGEGPLADETIVIGAHYDHWGRGGSGSAAPGSKEIHNGADDNASGTAALLEVARQLISHGKLPRRLVFIAFTGEELGLIGSARYVREPLFPLKKTVAMLNMDMVGRLQGNKLIVYGTGTAKQFDALIDRLGKKYGFDVTKKPEGYGPSDHSSFYAKQIPVLHYFTGTHTDYHRPSDDFEKLNVEGMRRVVELVVAATLEIAQAPDRPEYLETKSGQFVGGGEDRPYFGSIPDFAQEQPGYGMMGVTKGSPAEKAGIRGGDIMVKFGESRIGNLADFDSALRKYKSGDKVPVVLKRGDQEVKVEVVLDPPK